MCISVVADAGILGCEDCAAMYKGIFRYAEEHDMDFPGLTFIFDVDYREVEPHAMHFQLFGTREGKKWRSDMRIYSHQGED